MRTAYKLCCLSSRPSNHNQFPRTLIAAAECNTFAIVKFEVGANAVFKEKYVWPFLSETRMRFRLLLSSMCAASAITKFNSIGYDITVCNDWPDTIHYTRWVKRSSLFCGMCVGPICYPIGHLNWFVMLTHLTCLHHFLMSSVNVGQEIARRARCLVLFQATWSANHHGVHHERISYQYFGDTRAKQVA